MKPPLGQSLIELLVALAVATCVLSMGIPQLLRLKDDMTQRSATNGLLGALHFMRSHALTSSVTTSLCHGSSSCTDDKVWHGSLIVFTDRNGNGLIDDSDALLRSIPIPQEYTWRWSGFRSRTRISYASDGTTLAMNGTFTLCINTEPRSQVVVSPSGRPRTRPPAPEAKCN